ncbi:MAG: carboxylating nicotinate-nucleotide diphosphorylase [Kiritimatiellia bacterium]|nr:carboxylating nicotinate-nucleotide diphosphorylase [Kiritimatiellia bacterium]
MNNKSILQKPWLNPAVREFVRRALDEDIGSGDITSRALIDSERRIRASIIARGKYVVAGVELARLAFHLIDKGIVCRALVPDGRQVAAGQPLVILEGRARSILAAERTALNFLQRLTGIASLTAQYVAAVKAWRVKILDTRKTTPNMRMLEKYAVRCGGGQNHRLGLYDMILIKDNHRFLWEKNCSLAQAFSTARRKNPKKQIEVEVESIAQFKDALSAAPDWIMLDNMSVPLIKKCVAFCGGRSKLEASGGITLENVKAIAATGVDAISVGALTHSALAADLSLEVAD